VTGDLTDAKAPGGRGVQYEKEWQVSNLAKVQYEFSVTSVDKTRWQVAVLYESSMRRSGR
jgi:hypothetical protein